MSVSCFVTLGQRCAVSLRLEGDAFEVHVTTAAMDANRLQAYRAACRELGVKALVIELAPGVPVQPMTCLRVWGTPETALQAARDLGAALETQGFPTQRIKIEAAPWNAGVPVSAEDAAHEPAGRYFEFHARLVIAADANLGILELLCAAQGAHLSRNPLKTRLDGQQERFVTLRVGGMGRTEAEGQAAVLTRYLEQAGWTVEDTVMEYCLYDDHRALDAAWEAP
ncbi:hypothetical protein [Deinococcus sp. QL22]|uniref:hypothetical protein n=1 Tax=Deinococcus sp. QL22 TaxID=2939437 RepID=UPI002017C9C7|nr:hypothetical protein [Deinococcus sp. QL22]UQN10669.1 hypothetical protein M1R55_30300 [Deinococcus sp. QL22]